MPELATVLNNDVYACLTLRAQPAAPEGGINDSDDGVLMADWLIGKKAFHAAVTWSMRSARQWVIHCSTRRATSTATGSSMWSTC
jgi:hypothetical protein